MISSFISFVPFTGIHKAILIYIRLLKDNITRGEFNPFSGVLYSQDGMVQSDPNKALSPEEIITMDWLAENVVGSIPTRKELTDQAKPVTQQSGLEN